METKYIRFDTPTGGCYHIEKLREERKHMTLTRIIRLTSPMTRGDDVKEIQTKLEAAGYSVGDSGIDGIYGEDTEAAVIKYQTSKGLTVDGVVGNQTWTELHKTEEDAVKYTRLLKNIGKPYMQGEDVKWAQTHLVAYGFGVGSSGIDGKYGKDTAAAVTAYQTSRGLKVDGIVGKQTWGALAAGTGAVEPPEITGDLVDRFCGIAEQQVDNGSIYVLGAQGQTEGQITKPWIKKREHYNVVNYTRAINLWLRRLAAGFLRLRAFDCSGLIMWTLEQLGYSISDHNAHGIYYDLCAAISASELQKGDLLFHRNSLGRIHHVGIYLGDGYVEHAKGRSYGVVKEVYNPNKWNRYGRLKVLAA